MSCGRKIEKCMRHVQDDWRKIDCEQEDVMTKNAKYGYYLTITSAIFMYNGGFWFYFVKPLIAEPILTERNISIKPFPGDNIELYINV